MRAEVRMARIVAAIGRYKIGAVKIGEQVTYKTDHR